MDREAAAGLEVSPSLAPEVVPPLGSHKYFVHGPESNHAVYYPQNQSGQYEANQSRRRGFWVLAVIAVVCLAVALGAGLGAGLAAQHKPSASSSASAINANNATITVTQAADITSITPAPTTPPLSSSASATPASNAPVTVTQAADVTTITPAPTTPASPTCPAANASTYTASNKPLITDVAQVTQTSLAFMILCNTNTAEGDSVLDLQLITNVSSLNDCLDACALFNFQTKQGNFPGYGCTGVSWGYSDSLRVPHSCFLKSGVTLGSPNNTATYPGYNGAVLLND